MPRQSRRHAVPHDIGLRITMEQKERRPLPSGAREDASGGGVDPLGGKAWKEVGKIGHGLVSRFRRSYHLAAPAFTDVGNKGTLASHDPSVALHLTFL